MVKPKRAKKPVVKKGTITKRRVWSSTKRKGKTIASCKDKTVLDGFFRMDKVSEYIASDTGFVSIMTLAKERETLSPLTDEVRKKVVELEMGLQEKKEAMKHKRIDETTLLELGREGDDIKRELVWLKEDIRKKTRDIEEIKRNRDKAKWASWYWESKDEMLLFSQ